VSVSKHALAKRIGLPAIFGGFFWLGITSFGGGTAGWLYQQIVQRRRWIDDPAFLSAVGLSRIMPGSSGVNLTVQIGQLLRGGIGALVAVVALLAGPLAIVVALSVGYAKLAGIDAVHACRRRRDRSDLRHWAEAHPTRIAKRRLGRSDARHGALRRCAAMANAARADIPGAAQYWAGARATAALEAARPACMTNSAEH